MSLRRNTIYNLLGSLAPAAAALITIPLLLDAIGDRRFGVLALVWLLLGHFAVFDFGLSRATANRMARLGPDQHLERRRVLWTSLWLNLALGLVGAAALFLAAEPLIVRVFEVRGAMLEELILALPWLACGVPLLTLSAVLSGALEGRERFDVVNALQAFGAVLVQIAPVVVALTTSVKLDDLVLASIAARAITMALLLIACLRLVAPGGPLSPDRSYGRELFAYGFWISVSTLLIPFFMTLDKFMVGAVLGASAVTYYSVPDQLVRRISALPAAVARAIFPRASASDDRTARDLSFTSARVLISMVTPAVVVLVALMHPFLSWWIDARFAELASGPGVLLAVGIWLNSIAIVPSVYLQAVGRPQVTAKCHLIEILPHVVVLWACVHWFGAVGAAFAMLIVTTLDMVLLMTFARMPIWRTSYFWQGGAWVAVASIAGWGGYADSRWRWAAAVLIVGGAILWTMRTSPQLAGMAMSGLGRVTTLRRRG